ncbi:MULTISPECIES: hypothetical protein [Lelliottia]|nr:MULTISPECIES: hypothetical protein [Lelliottia]
MVVKSPDICPADKLPLPRLQTPVHPLHRQPAPAMAFMVFAQRMHRENGL